jgi:hypothetical protein
MQDREQIAEPDEVEKIWQDFWLLLVTDPDGCLNIRKLKEELADYHFVMQQVRKVYDHITGGKLSKPTYFAEVVIEEADAHYEEMYTEEVKDFKFKNEE